MKARLTNARLAQLCQAIQHRRADAARRGQGEHSYLSASLLCVYLEDELARLVCDLAGSEAMNRLQAAFQADVTPADIEASAQRHADLQARIAAYRAKLAPTA